jgi:DNA-binding transcriptional ArsR family regulator
MGNERRHQSSKRRRELGVDREIADRGTRRTADAPALSCAGRRRRDQRLSDQAIEMVAFRCRLFGEPTRIRLLELLNEDEATVQQLTDRLKTTHPNVSKHLSLLHQAGVVSRHKEGATVRYALIDWTGWWLIEQLGASIAAQLDELREAFDAEPGCE